MLLALQFRHELTKMFARRRTYIGFGAFLAVEALVVILLNLPKPRESFRRTIENNGFGFDQYFSGLTLGLLVLSATWFLLPGLFLSLVAGDVVSKEVEDGTMRMMLCRPVSRWRIGGLKIGACVVYVIALTFFYGISAWLIGLLYRGWGGLFAVNPVDHIFALYDPWPGLCRYVLGLVMLSVCLLPFVCLAFLFSCLNMKPAAATVVTLTVLFFDFIFRNVPYFESLKTYFLTGHMAAWIAVFGRHVDWRQMTIDLGYLAAVDVTCVVLGLVVFSQRDFKN